MGEGKSNEQKYEPVGPNHLTDEEKKVADDVAPGEEELKKIKDIKNTGDKVNEYEGALIKKVVIDHLTWREIRDAQAAAKERKKLLEGLEDDEKNLKKSNPTE